MQGGVVDIGEETCIGGEVQTDPGPELEAFVSARTLSPGLNCMHTGPHQKC